MLNGLDLKMYYEKVGEFWAMKRIYVLAATCILSLVLLSGCGNSQNRIFSEPIDSNSSAQTEEKPSSQQDLSSVPPSDGVLETQSTETVTNVNEDDMEMKMGVQVGDYTFTASLEKNAAVDALIEMLESGSVTIEMSDYSGFEKVGSLGADLPASNSQTTTHAGDIVLYQGNQIVIFYGSNSWSYTRLGRIDDLTGWEEALGDGNVVVTFFLKE